MFRRLWLLLHKPTPPAARLQMFVTVNKLSIPETIPSDVWGASAPSLVTPCWPSFGSGTLMLVAQMLILSRSTMLAHNTGMVIRRDYFDNVPC